METENNSAAGDFEHIETDETGVNGQKQIENGAEEQHKFRFLVDNSQQLDDSNWSENSSSIVEMLRREFRAEIGAVKTDNKLLLEKNNVLTANMGELKAQNDELLSIIGEVQAKLKVVDGQKLQMYKIEKKIAELEFALTSSNGKEKQLNNVVEGSQQEATDEKLLEMEKKFEQLEKITKQSGQRMVDLWGKVTVLEDQFLINLNGENEDQVLTAMQMCLERPRTLLAVFDKSQELYNSGKNLLRHVEALHLSLRALGKHLHDKDVQIAASGFIMLIKDKIEMNQYTKKLAVLAIIDGMENHQDSPAMIKNCCLGLAHFVPQENWHEFSYGRIANLLAKVLETHNSDVIIQQAVVLLLFSMVCHVEDKFKIEMGETGVIEGFCPCFEFISLKKIYGLTQVILQQISCSLQENTCVVEAGWSFLWNVTDGVPANCERFLRAEGLALFKRCYRNFADKNPEFLPSMIGVMLNIAEVPQLRDWLMSNEYLEIFCTLLNGDIEASYMNAGILAYLLSDKHWTKLPGVTVSRGRLNMLISQTIEKWDMHKNLSINYKSLECIIRLSTQWNVFGSQHWAVWTLANLTTTEADNYCRFVMEERCMELLEQLSTDARSTGAIRQLACIVIKNVEDWRNLTKLMWNNNKWHISDQKWVQASADGLIVANIKGVWTKVRAKQHVSRALLSLIPGQKLVYWEVQIKNGSASEFGWVGPNVLLNDGKCIGEHPDSFSISFLGNYWKSGRKVEGYGKGFDEGDVVGSVLLCTRDDRIKLFFTLNGALNGEPIVLKCSQDLQLFPAVSFVRKDTLVEANFGADPVRKPFKFDVNAHETQLFG